MRATPYHRTCGATVRKFFDDYDLLPPKYKRMLESQDRPPNFDDIRAAWELAAEEGSITDIQRYLHCFEEENKAAAQAEADRKRKEKQLQKIAERMKRKGPYTTYTPVYRDKLMKRTDKHQRLVQVVTGEAAVAALTSRKENKDVVAVNQSEYYVKRELVGYKKEVVIPKEEPVYQENLKPTHIVKALHNA